VSATKTELSERKLSSLITSQQSIIVSDTTRLGRHKVMELVGAIGQIASYGELHLAYNDTIINSENVDNAEIIFTVIGQSFASAVEVKNALNEPKQVTLNERPKGYHLAGRRDRRLSPGLMNIRRLY